MSKILVEHFHGAPLRQDPTAMAFPHRDGGYSILIIAQWRDAAHNEENIAWARETYDRLTPHSRKGTYTNYMDDDEDGARIRQAFGNNFPRLQKLKTLSHDMWRYLSIEDLFAFEATLAERVARESALYWI